MRGSGGSSVAAHVPGVQKALAEFLVLYTHGLSIAAAHAYTNCSVGKKIRSGRPAWAS